MSEQKTAVQKSTKPKGKETVYLQFGGQEVCLDNVRKGASCIV